MSRFKSKGPSSFARLDESEDSSDDLEDPLLASSSLRDQVASIKTAGRQAKAGGAAMSATRTGDALGGVKKMGLAGLEVGLDAALPGAGYAVSALSSVSAMRDAKNEGRGVLGAGVKDGGMIAAGFIPVVGEFLSFADGAWETLHAIGESSRSRTARKLAKAEELLAGGRERLQQVAEIRPQVEAAGDASLIAALNKAEQRLNASMDKVQSWIAKKSDHMSMPLASAAAMEDGGDGDDGWGPSLT